MLLYQKFRSKIAIITADRATLTLNLRRQFQPNSWSLTKDGKMENKSLQRSIKIRRSETEPKKDFEIQITLRKITCSA